MSNPNTIPFGATPIAKPNAIPFGAAPIVAPKQTEQKQSLLGRVAEFTGVPGVIRGVGQAAKVAGGLITGNEVTPSVSPSQFAGSVGKALLTAGTIATPGLASGVRGLAGVGARALEGGVMSAAIQALDNIENKKALSEGTGKAALFGAAIPGVAGLASEGKRLLGRGAQKAGETIQKVVIRPGAKDLADGFKIETIQKYDLGGSLGQTLKKAQDKIDDLASQLSTKIKSSDAPVNLAEILARTKKSLGADKAKAFGNIKGTQRVLDGLEGEIAEVSPAGIVDMVTAQHVKQGAGSKGSWVFGSADPDATAVEKVYTAFYRELKKEIEDKAPEGIKAINSQISELIPVVNAVLRRIPVEERNSVLSVNDMVSLAASAIDPSALTLLAANRASKSGRVGAALVGAGKKLQQKAAPVTNIGKRLFGR